MSSVVGGFASCASVLLNVSPVQDVLDIHRTQRVNERSILPYCMMMVDGANWVVFAALINDIFPIGATNAFGFLAGATYSSVYLCYSWNDKRTQVRREAWCIFLGALVIITLISGAAIAIAMAWTRKVSTDHVGYVIDVFNVFLYGSPLRLAFKVFRTGSTSGMYLPLSLTITAAAALWATYGFLTSDWFVAAPQSVGLLAGIAQLLLFARFGIADNNEPATGPPNGPSQNGDGDVTGSGNDFPKSMEDPPPKQSDDPSRTHPPTGDGKSGGQLREPLISGTS